MYPLMFKRAMEKSKTFIYKYLIINKLTTHTNSSNTNIQHI